MLTSVIYISYLQINIPTRLSENGTACISIAYKTNFCQFGFAAELYISKSHNYGISRQWR